eukprot:GDKI01017055.1.p2 GENE.GDKI01017055.1~~GDKI01017055.1.p2  ORF type:complete len:112 (+),score=18.93 GDKI01017055.1:228-563(+)
MHNIAGKQKFCTPHAHTRLQPRMHTRKLTHTHLLSRTDTHSSHTHAFNKTTAKKSRQKKNSSSRLAVRVSLPAMPLYVHKYTRATTHIAHYTTLPAAPRSCSTQLGGSYLG